MQIFFIFFRKKSIFEAVFSKILTFGVNIEFSTFENCSGLTSITVPESVTNISIGAFGYCHGLKSIKLPNSVTNIGDYSFNECSNLKSITIPNSVTNIGECAFWGCLRLTDVYCLTEEVPQTDWNAFENTPIEKTTLHVPAASVGKYKATSPWSNFGKIVAIEE